MTVCGALLLLLLTWLAYRPSLGNGYVWDDDSYLTHNATLAAPDGLWRIWTDPSASPQYYPMVFTSFWVEYHLWGLQPSRSHAINLALHALAVLLGWLILRRLRLPGAWWAAAVFALHPVHVESVAWITERKNVLSSVCYFAALLSYLRYAGLAESASAPSGTSARSARAFYLSSLGWYVCALFSKTVTCSFPAVAFLLLWWKHRQLTRRDVAALVPFVLIGVALALVTVWFEHQHARAQGVDWALTAPQRLLIAGRALWFYAGKLVWPHPLMFIYPRWSVEAAELWSWRYPVLALAVCWALWRRRGRWGRGPCAAVACFAVTLVPALGFVNFYPMRFSFVADHFQYLASFSLIAGVIALVTYGLRRAGRAALGIGGLAGLLALAVLGRLTWAQTRVYRDADTLWRDTLAKNPSAWIAHNNLGVALNTQGRSDEALLHFAEALRLKPDFIDAYNNLGVALAEQGHRADAAAAWAHALRLDPRFAEAHNNLGLVFAAQGLRSEAMAHYAEAIRLAPQYVEVYRHLGQVLAEERRLPEAALNDLEALRLRPGDPETQFHLGVVLMWQGRLDEASGYVEQSLRGKPGWPEAHFYLGNVRFLQGRPGDAIDRYQEALRLRPDFPEAHNNLGYALVRQGRRQAAIAHYTEALRLQPDYADARNNLSRLLAQPEESGEAAR